MLVSPAVDAAIAGFFGLMIGSFLNVVIYRLPKMMEREWAVECVALAGKEPEPAAPLDLVRPRSRCPACGHQIRWYENIPVLSYLALRGKCSACGTRISLRYPVVELITGLLFALCAARWGFTPLAAAWAAFASLLVCQFLIDMDTQLLPDDLNYPLLWLGLLVATAGWTVSPSQALWGAALGYLSLWGVAKGFKVLRGIEGMGAGDFKLLAALGAWFGAKFLLAIILLSSVVGAVMGIVMLLVGRLAHREIPMPFGPYLAGAGVVCLVVGPQRLASFAPFLFPFGH